MQRDLLGRMRNECQLITYPDSLGKNLSDLTDVLETHLQGIFGGIHILPFYPSSGDRGFAPIDYGQVDEPFGTWAEIDALGETYDLVVDFMINHISRRSHEFQDFVAKGEASAYRHLFILYRDLDGGKGISEADLKEVYTRKPRPPYVDVALADGTSERVWCTFDEEQIDLNWDNSPTTEQWLDDVLGALVDHRVAMVRADAFAYATKKVGTSCFFIEPEVWHLLDRVREVTAKRNVEILPEVHEHHSFQLKIAEHGHWVYDFALPVLVLHALYEKTNVRLKHWLNICPRKQITTLDTHDGLPIVDVVDLLTEEELERTKEHLFTYGANVKKRYNTPSYANLDIYQINCTYYSALGDQDDDYLLARAIQFFAPGIPQVYYVGLLAGRNDIELVESTKIGRNINRHNYTVAEVAEEVKRPVVQRLFELMRFRNTHPAFGGTMAVHDSPEHELIITWILGDERATLRADLKAKTFEIDAT
jgi:sucrose phosphorylase